jgi:D-methionine transport system permease protein
MDSLDWIAQWIPNVITYWDYIVKATWETIYMVGLSLLFSALLGIPLGVLLVITSPGHLLPLAKLNAILGGIVNIFRSIPYIVLVLLLIPFAKWVLGTSIGTNAAIISLVAGSAPFIARLVETALRDVSRGVIEAAQAMGANLYQIVAKVLIPEAMPAIISGLTVTMVGLIGYSAMAGVIGAGGLGAMAYTHGFNGYKPDIMYFITILLVILVQVVQSFGDWASRKIDKR